MFSLNIYIFSFLHETNSSDVMAQYICKTDIWKFSMWAHNKSLSWCTKGPNTDRENVLPGLRDVLIYVVVIYLFYILSIQNFKRWICRTGFLKRNFLLWDNGIQCALAYAYWNFFPLSCSYHLLIYSRAAAKIVV